MGRYEGEPDVRWLASGREVKLLRPYSYIEDNGIRWDVPKGATVDGASIPQILWSATKGPFEGVYRDASIIHDWYCHLRSRPWQKVHRVFYDAMLTSGVSPIRANVMYGAVYWGGPRWTESTVANVNLARLSGKRYYRPEFDHDGMPVDHETEFQPLAIVLQDYKFPFSDEDLKSIEHHVEVSHPTVEQIEGFVESRTAPLSRIKGR